MYSNPAPNLRADGGTDGMPVCVSCFGIGIQRGVPGLNRGRVVLCGMGSLYTPAWTVVSVSFLALHPPLREEDGKSEDGKAGNEKRKARLTSPYQGPAFSPAPVVGMPPIPAALYTPNTGLSGVEIRWREGEDTHEISIYVMRASCPNNGVVDRQQEVEGRVPAE
jgi:hypothetical protein